MNKDFWLDRPVLVTGGEGFLGSHLCVALHKAGAIVTVIARDQVGFGVMTFVTRVAHGDVCDVKFVDRVLAENEIDTVFHLAAQVLVTVANGSPLSTWDSNVRGTYTLLEACRRSMDFGGRIIVASTDKVYGEAEGGGYKETDRLEAVYPYDVSKLCTDVIARSYYETYGMHVCVTRNGNYYGPGDKNWSRLIPGTIRSIIRGQRPFIRSNGRTLREYFYVEDAVEANIVLAERALDFPGQAFNFSSGEGYSTLRMVDTISKMMGSKLEPIVHGAADLEISNQFLDCSKARELLGWRPKYNVLSGLPPTIAYYEELLERESNY